MVDLGGRAFAWSIRHENQLTTARFAKLRGFCNGLSGLEIFTTDTNMLCSVLKTRTVINFVLESENTGNISSVLARIRILIS